MLTWNICFDRLTYCYYNNAVNITFDPVKDAMNRTKHGLSLALTVDLEWDMLVGAPDTRRDYGEQRMIGFAPIGNRVYCVVFTDRGNERRVISLRKANSREVKRYVRTIETP